MSNRMVISSSVREAGNDPIFHIAELAKNRIAEIGSEPVINSTIGSLMDDDGNLVAFDSVYSTFRSLNIAEIAGYASIAGIPEFLENVKNYPNAKLFPIHTCDENQQKAIEMGLNFVVDGQVLDLR